ncbi:rhodanese-like protein [Teladorsagia circumcincta]|uniref:Rhodanese-like protein n=1 Tax=Teladorsagia circumcincta TaxID=45464 RepID=A0A2G9TTK9_TELCI|nr:rhodanese-like protein [Teladorsagia circumcincta]
MPPFPRKYEIDITANHLLTLLITKRKICLFEASTGDEVISRFWNYPSSTHKTMSNSVAREDQEYDGEASGALYGHIRGAVNVPVDAMYDWKSNKWRTTSEIQQVFLEAGLSRGKPVIVYCSTSLRSSLIWWSLKRLDYDARIYFGGWPEWVVRAPDDLKVLGKNIGNH